ncbi:MAG: hypothetical protein V1784_07360 [bacterium]
MPVFDSLARRKTQIARGHSMHSIQWLAKEINDACAERRYSWALCLLRKTAKVWRCRKELLNQDAQRAFWLIETNCPERVAPFVLSKIVSSK